MTNSCVEQFDIGACMQPAPYFFVRVLPLVCVNQHAPAIFLSPVRSAAALR
jgi:hypothetical protein